MRDWRHKLQKAFINKEQIVNPEVSSRLCLEAERPKGRFCVLWSMLGSCAGVGG